MSSTEDTLASILDTVKKMLGIDPRYDVFDVDIIVLINGAFMVLRQLGVGPPKGFSIRGRYESWADFLGDKIDQLQGVQEYVYLKVKTVFDPPSNASVLEAMKAYIAEYEWRSNVQVETPCLEAVDGDDNSGSSGGNTGGDNPGGVGTLDYNELNNKPSLNGVVLQGDVEMDIASKEYVDEAIGEIEYGRY